MTIGQEKIDASLEALTTMSSAHLREQWVRITSGPVPRVSPSLLRLALGYEIQCRALGGLSRATRQRLDQLATAKTRTSAATAGMRLVRAWNGTIHVVTVGEGGAIRWSDRDWRSLSEVARQITGTRWSGPAFFGLKAKAKAA